MCFSTRQNKELYYFSFKLAGKNTQMVPSYIYLGVILDQTLNLKLHENHN